MSVVTYVTTLSPIPHYRCRHLSTNITVQAVCFLSHRITRNRFILYTIDSGPAVLVPVPCRESHGDVEIWTTSGIFSEVGVTQSVSILLRGDAKLLVKHVWFYCRQSPPGPCLVRTVGLLLLPTSRHVRSPAAISQPTCSRTNQYSRTRTRLLTSRHCPCPVSRTAC